MRVISVSQEMVGETAGRSWPFKSRVFACLAYYNYCGCDFCVWVEASCEVSFRDDKGSKVGDRDLDDDMRFMHATVCNPILTTKSEGAFEADTAAVLGNE
mmetsp:Transcript_29374/g.41602  ORF Transcript_29374/g.41602 Transcript_29374/m.41602 type:complete len:100 (+) Transcript_29374:21-320(+)